MQIDYDPEADALYVHFREGEIDDTRQISKYIYVDEDKSGQPLGLEILFASQVLAGRDITSVTVNIGRAAQAAQIKLQTKVPFTIYYGRSPIHTTPPGNGRFACHDE